MTPAGRKRAPSRRQPQQPAQTDQDTDTQRVPRSLYIRADLLERMRAASVYLSSYVPEAGVRSLSDLVEPGVRRELQRLEKRYHNGEPFPPVASSPRGRPSGT